MNTNHDIKAYPRVEKEHIWVKLIYAIIIRMFVPVLGGLLVIYRGHINWNKKTKKMRYWIFLTIIIIFSNCNNISTLKHEKVKFKDLPFNIRNCITNSYNLHDKKNKMLIELPKDINPSYKVQIVLIGPWVSYVKLININTNVYYKIDQTEPYPYFIFGNKLYIPNSYNIFTTVKDYSTLEFTCYTLK